MIGIKQGQFRNLGDYIDFSLRNRLLSKDGKWLVIIKIGYSKDPFQLMAYKLAYPNESGYLFTTKKAARDYMEVLREFEPDLKRSGGFLAQYKL